MRSMGMRRLLRVGSALIGLMLALIFAVSPAAASPGTMATQPYPGMLVCKNGPVTGYTCGHVYAVNVTVCFPQGCLYGLAQTNMYSAPGDQGAPVYFGTELIGTVVGAGGGWTFFDPI